MKKEMRRLEKLEQETWRDMSKQLEVDKVVCDVTIKISREEKRNYKAREYHVKWPSAKTFVRRPKRHHVKFT